MVQHLLILISCMVLEDLHYIRAIYSHLLCSMYSFYHLVEPKMIRLHLCTIHPSLQTKSIGSHWSCGRWGAGSLRKKKNTVKGINGLMKKTKQTGRERAQGEREPQGSQISLTGKREEKSAYSGDRFVPDRHQTSADLPCRSVSMTTLSPGKLAWQQWEERSGSRGEERGERQRLIRRGVRRERAEVEEEDEEEAGIEWKKCEKKRWWETVRWVTGAEWIHHHFFNSICFLQQEM